MCVIIIKQKSNRISLHTLENASQINPHGLGVVWLDTFETNYFESSEYNVLDTERPFIAHFRYATVGAINKANMHPFVCGDKTDELLMMNGTASGYGNKNITDSQDLANELGGIARNAWSDIFHNRFYLGEIWLKKGDVPIKGTHKPLVDEDIFTQAQQVIRQHDKNK